MIRFGFRRRGDNDWIEAVRPELHALPVPPARDDLLDRIFRSRGMGARVILPDPRSPVVQSRRRLLLAAAAGLVLLVLPLGRARTPSRDGHDAPASGERTALEWMSAPIAFAQTEPRDSKMVVPAMDLSRTDRLRPATLEYERTWRDSTGRMTGRLVGLVTMRLDTVNGVPAWRLVSTNSGARRGRTLTTIDSVFVARADLSLLRRTTLEKPYSRYDEIRIVQTFRGDSVVGRMNAKGADASADGRPIARRLPIARAPYIADALVPVSLIAVDLRAGWSGSASIVGWAVIDRDVYMPIELRVEGEESITVPAGRFECWRLSIRGGGHAVSHWVRKSDGVGVRSVEQTSNGERREVLLLSARSP
jgi:hypothetical protein